MSNFEDAVRNVITIPETVFRSLVIPNPQGLLYVGDKGLKNFDMHLSKKYALHNGTICAQSKDAVLVFMRFYRKTVLGAQLGYKNVDEYGVSPNTPYDMLALQFYLRDSTDANSPIAAEILFHFSLKKIFGHENVDFWVEPSDDPSLNVWREGREHDNFTLCAESLFNLFHYVQYKLVCNEKQIIRVHELSEQRVGEIGAQKEYRSRPIHVGNIQYQYVYDPHETTRRYERHIEAWGVKGHYRHYKSGKVVFIEPHIRGTGSVKTTEYKIL